MTFLWPSFSSSLESVKVCVKASFTKLQAREMIPALKNWQQSFLSAVLPPFLSLFCVSAFLLFFSVSVGFLFSSESGINVPKHVSLFGDIQAVTAEHLCVCEL